MISSTNKTSLARCNPPSFSLWSSVINQEMFLCLNDNKIIFTQTMLTPYNILFCMSLYVTVNNTLSGIKLKVTVKYRVGER